jgi:xanthine phosphoribosyltransferase
MERPKTVIGGEEFIDDILSLVANLKQEAAARGSPWRAVVGVVRGGVFPAQRVAEALGIAYREIRVSYYQGMVRGAEPVVLQSLSDEPDGEGLLVVDDVIDSGGTTLRVGGMWPRCDLAAVYTKPEGRAALASGWRAAAFHGRQMDDNWIVFPWDQPDWENRSRRLIALFRQKIAE